MAIARRKAKKKVTKKKVTKRRVVRRATRSRGDATAARELVLYAENTNGLTPSGTKGQGKAIAENIDRKISRGTFDESKLPKLFEYLMTSAAKAYARDFGDPSEWSVMFTAETRRMAAKEMAEDYVMELRAQGKLPARRGARRRL